MFHNIIFGLMVLVPQADCKECRPQTIQSAMQGNYQRRLSLGVRGKTCGGHRSSRMLGSKSRCSEQVFMQYLPALICEQRSSSWSKVRADFLKVQKCCQACLSRRGLEVHHIIPFSVDPTKELDCENLIVLCHYCHFVVGHLCNWNNVNNFVVLDSATLKSRHKQKQSWVEPFRSCLPPTP